MSQRMGLPDKLSLAWSDDALDDAVVAVLRGEIEPALDLLSVTRGDTDRRELCAGVLGEAAEDHLPQLRELAEHDGDDAERWLLLGSALTCAAWTARGSGVASMTAQQQMDRLITQSVQARTALRRSAKLLPTDPVPWTTGLRCALGAPEYDGECDKVYAKITQLGPDLFTANTVRLLSLTRTWYGSGEQMLAFARERTRRVAAGHPLLALVALAHIENYLDAMMRGTFVGRFVRAFRGPDRSARGEVDAASDRLLSSDTFANHPHIMTAQQIFAVYYHQAEDPSRAKPHLARGGDRAMPWPWGYFGDHPEQFAAARDAAGLGPPIKGANG